MTNWRRRCEDEAYEIVNRLKSTQVRMLHILGLYYITSLYYYHYITSFHFLRFSAYFFIGTSNLRFFVGPLHHRRLKI